MTTHSTRPARTWLFVSATPNFGGHEVMLLRWLHALAQSPGLVTPRLLAREGGRLLASASDAVRCPPFGAPASTSRTARLHDLWTQMRTLRDTVRSLQPECVVVVSGALGAHLPHVLLLRLMGVRVLLYVPLLGTFASMGYRLGAWKDAFVRSFYARVPRGWVAITGAQADAFRAWARPTGPVFVLPNTVAPAVEQAPPILLRALGPGQALRVLLLGRLDAHQKGLDLLLAHLSHLARAQPSALAGLHFRLVGEGPYQAQIEALLQAQPALARHVELQAWAPAQAAMADGDVLLLPSRYEGVPLVMLEAMALGLPVVAADLPGTSPYVPRSARFVVGDIGAALDILHGLRPLAPRAALAEAGRSCFEAHASGRAFTGQVHKLVRDVRARYATGAAARGADGATDAPAHANTKLPEG